MRSERLPRTSDKDSPRTFGSRIALGVLAAVIGVIIIAFIVGRAQPSVHRVADAVPSEGVARDGLESIAVPPHSSGADPSPVSLASAAPAPADPPATCRHSPVRGCTAYRDERGCYHCPRCARRFHFDMDQNLKAVSLKCLDMPAGPIFVELTGSAATARWSVAMTMAGSAVSQSVTPNLGIAYFGEFRGGNVELAASLLDCSAEHSACSGDAELVVSVRRDLPTK